MSKIKTEELKTLFDLVIKKLEFEDVKEIEFEINFYRIITADKWSIYEKETGIVIGSLEDDIMELKKRTLDKDRFFTYVDFDRISSVLRAISESRNPVE